MLPWRIQKITSGKWLEQHLVQLTSFDPLYAQSHSKYTHSTVPHGHDCQTDTEVRTMHQLLSFIFSIRLVTEADPEIFMKGEVPNFDSENIEIFFVVNYLSKNISPR